MATWHGYLCIYQLPPFWTSAQIAEALVALEAIGTQASSNPAHVTAGVYEFDNLAIIVESLFDTAEIARAALVTTLNNGVTGTSEIEIDAWLDFELKNYPNDWATSLVETHEFVESETTAVGWTPDSGFCIAVLPDTQYLSAAQFLALGQWIVDNAAALSIEAVIHVGDVVETYNNAAQWAGADAAFDLLDTAGIPYLVTIGNHDYEGSGYACTAPRDSTWYNNYITQARYTANGWWNGAFYDVADSENAYFTITVGGQDYILLGIEFGPRAAVLAWADGIIAANPGDDVILFTHCYLESGGDLQDGASPYRPGLFCQCGGDYNDGDDIWNTIKVRDNVIVVACGHMLDDGAARRVTDSDGGTSVAQMLSGHIRNQRGTINNGFIRLVNIRTGDTAMSVRTYTVINDVWLEDPENKFELAM